MQVVGDTQYEAAGKRLVGRLAALAAEVQVIVHRIAQCLAKLGDRLSLKGDHVADADNFAVEEVVFGVEGDISEIALVVHHGVTPASVRNRRSDSTLPLSVSFRGCGR